MYPQTPEVMCRYAELGTSFSARDGYSELVRKSPGNWFVGNIVERMKKAPCPAGKSPRLGGEVGGDGGWGRSLC